MEQGPVGVANLRGIVYNLDKPAQIKDLGWIKPGKVIGDIQLSTASAKEVVDVLVELRGQHVLLDAGWYGPETDPASNATKWHPQPKHAPLDVREVVQYASSRGIGVFLYVNDIALKRRIDKILPTYLLGGGRDRIWICFH